MLFSQETFSRDGLFLKRNYFREYRDVASMSLNVQHLIVVIVGDGASTSRFNETFYIAFFVVFIAFFRGFFVKKICCRSFCLYF